MKLGVDARMLVGKWAHRGIGGYILSILKCFDHTRVLAFIPKKQKINNYEFVSSGISFFPLWEQLLLPFYLKKKNIKYVLFPSITAPIFKLYDYKQILVVYDLIFMLSFNELPASGSLYNTLGRIYRRLIFPFIINRSDFVITISEYTKNELINKFNIDSNKIQVIPCSISSDWFNYNIVPACHRKKYFLTVSGDSPSKNLLFLLNVISILKKRNQLNGFKLVIVGIGKKSLNYFNSLIYKLGISNEIIIEKFLSKGELQQLYREAWAALTFSLYEGFGVPIIEAMASGTPVICSNTTSLPEVAGNAAIFISPKNIDSALSAIINIMDMSNFDRDAMAQAGFDNAEKYNEFNIMRITNDYISNMSL